MPHVNSCYLNGRCTHKKNILKQKNRSPPTIADAPADENAPIEPQIRHDNPHFLQWFLKLHVHVATCTCMYMYTCTHVYMYTCYNTHMYIHVYTYIMCTYMHVSHRMDDTCARCAHMHTCAFSDCVARTH